MKTEQVFEICQNPLQEFKYSKPWTGAFQERLNKFIELREKFDAVFGYETVLVFRKRKLDGLHGRYEPLKKRITLYNKLSVITFLHEYAHVLGANEDTAVDWSVELFRRFFPVQFKKLKQDGIAWVKQ